MKHHKRPLFMRPFQTDDNLTVVIGSCPSTTPKSLTDFWDPGCTSGTGGWALLREIYKLIIALHWQSPDEGHVNFRFLYFIFLVCFYG
jgi:hypothetical protein